VDLWTNEYEVPAQLLKMLEIPDIPLALTQEIRNAVQEVARDTAVSYPTKAKIEYYIHQY
jgi:hypothetical protein